MAVSVGSRRFLRGISSASARRTAALVRSNSNASVKVSNSHLMENMAWINTLNEAKKIVDYPSESFSFRLLMNGEYSSVVQKIFNQDHLNHPLKNTLESLLFGDENCLDSCWGLIVLLISKAVGLQVDMTQDERTSGILCSQRSLADVTETIRTAHIIHKSIAEMSRDHPEPSAVGDLELGNKMALLCGDYLHSNSFRNLANLRNQEVLSLMNTALIDLVEAEFQEDSVKLAAADEDWRSRHKPSWGSLIGKGCQGTLMLAGHGTRIQQQGRQFGQHLALAWQKFVDLGLYLPRSEQTMDTGSKLALQGHLLRTMELLECLEESDASAALTNIVQILMSASDMTMTKQCY